MNDETNKESYITIHTERLINRSDPAEYQDRLSPTFQFCISFDYMKEIYKNVGIAVLCWYCANKSTHMIMTNKGHSSAAIWRKRETMSRSLCKVFRSLLVFVLQRLLVENQRGPIEQ